jgi:hypothetical protein
MENKMISITEEELRYLLNTRWNDIKISNIELIEEAKRMCKKHQEKDEWWAKVDEAESKCGGVMAGGMLVDYGWKNESNPEALRADPFDKDPAKRPKINLKKLYSLEDAINLVEDGVHKEMRVNGHDRDWAVIRFSESGLVKPGYYDYGFAIVEAVESDSIPQDGWRPLNNEL